MNEIKKGPSDAALGLDVTAPCRAGAQSSPSGIDGQPRKRPFTSFPVFREARRGLDFAAVNAHTRAELRRMVQGITYKLATLLFDEALLRKSLTVTFTDKVKLAVQCRTERHEIDRALAELAERNIVELLPATGRRIKVRVNTDSATWTGTETITAEDAALAREGTSVDLDDAQMFLTLFDEPDLNGSVSEVRLQEALARVEAEARQQVGVNPPLPSPPAVAGPDKVAVNPPDRPALISSQITGQSEVQSGSSSKTYTLAFNRAAAGPLSPEVEELRKDWLSVMTEMERVNMGGWATNLVRGFPATAERALNDYREEKKRADAGLRKPIRNAGAFMLDFMRRVDPKVLERYPKPAR